MKETSHLFHAGMEAYFACDMVSARTYFDKVYQANPDDTTTFGFLHKMHGYIHSGVPEGWTGVEVMQRKTEIQWCQDRHWISVFLSNGIVITKVTKVPSSVIVVGNPSVVLKYETNRGVKKMREMSGISGGWN